MNSWGTGDEFLKEFTQDVHHGIGDNLMALFIRIARILLRKVLAAKIVFLKVSVPASVYGDEFTLQI